MPPLGHFVRVIVGDRPGEEMRGIHALPVVAGVKSALPRNEWSNVNFKADSMDCQPRATDHDLPVASGRQGMSPFPASALLGIVGVNGAVLVNPAPEFQRLPFRQLQSLGRGRSCGGLIHFNCFW